MAKEIRGIVRFVIIFLTLIINIDLINYYQKLNEASFVNSQIKIDLNNNLFVSSELIFYVESKGYDFSFTETNKKISYVLSCDFNSFSKLLNNQKIIINDTYHLKSR
ncbi:TPA: hypothetical protein GXZ34_04165 [bacterium]|jgi:hypothetical protein|nr:hypothetical protein [bacterium]